MKADNCCWCAMATTFPWSVTFWSGVRLSSWRRRMCNSYALLCRWKRPSSRKARLVWSQSWYLLQVCQMFQNPWFESIWEHHQTDCFEGGFLLAEFQVRVFDLPTEFEKKQLQTHIHIYIYIYYIYIYRDLYVIMYYSRLNKLSPRKRICAKQSHVRITCFLKHFEAFWHRSMLTFLITTKS